MNSRILALVALLASCTSTYLSPVDAEVSVAPALLDVGDVLLGTEVTGSVQVSVDGGAATVLGVNVLDTLGTGFSYDGPPSFEVDADGIDEVVVTFHPTVAGFASAVVQVTTDAKPDMITIEVRGRAVAAALVATPEVLDFGVVPVGSSASTTIRLENAGAADLVIDGASVGSPDVTVDGAFPLALAHGAAVDLDVTCAPSSAGVLSTSIAFDVGSDRTPGLVIVRANDCSHGLPEAYDVDVDGVTTCGGDCDDHDASVHVGAPEEPDDVDDDCDSAVDEGTVRADDDGDGYCEDPTGCVGTAVPGDCVDDDPAIAPDVAEAPADGVDNDCDGTVDDGSADLDHDGFGPGGGDCDDANAQRHPGRPELVNGVDDDCDGAVDEGTRAADDDGDGYCDALSTCYGGAIPGDCDDGDPLRKPTGTELPNFVDDDCDGKVDEGTDQGDDDGDGFTEIGGDCDDADAGVSPMRGNCP